MKVDLQKKALDRLAYFRFKKLGGKFLLTNEIGEYAFLSGREFQDMVTGKIDDQAELYRSLAGKGFFKKELDAHGHTNKYRKKNYFLFDGPSLHIFVVTLRCNNKCVYCHASSKDIRNVEKDMTIETARKALKIVFSSPSKEIFIDFQGGEPLVNWPVVKYIIEEAGKLSKVKGKKLNIVMTTNLNLMTREKFTYLLKKGVGVCTSLDGPEKLHNRNRPMPGGNNHGNVVRWAGTAHRDVVKSKGSRQLKINAIATITRNSLAMPKEIVDEYAKAGLDEIFLHPLNPYGNSQLTWKKTGYSADEYVKFYKKALDYIIKLNLKGRRFSEKTAVDFLDKIFSEYDPNMLDLRSPCGAGISMLAYNYDGGVYTCDSGRLLAEAGDESFRLGSVAENYQQLVDNATVRTMCTASCLVGLPGCNDCVYAPYCGVCPIYNYSEQKNIFGQMPNNDRCRINKEILDHLFEKMQDEETQAIFKSWLKLKK